MSLIHSQVDLVSGKNGGVGNIANLLQPFSYGDALRKPIAPWPPLNKGKEPMHSLEDISGASSLQLIVPSKQGF